MYKRWVSLVAIVVLLMSLAQPASAIEPEIGPKIPWLVSAERTSPDLRGPNDVVSVAWEVKDIDVEHVVFAFEGDNGTSTAAQWFGKGRSGVATVKLDEYAHSDDLELTRMYFSGPKGYIEFTADGEIWANNGPDTSGQEMPEFAPFAFTHNNPYSPIAEVVPPEVTFNDFDGIERDTYTIPKIKGVRYLVGSDPIEAGTYAGYGTVTVAAIAKTGFKLGGQKNNWIHTFKTGSEPYNPPRISPFIDVATDQLFYKEMSWLAEEGISTGWVGPGNTRLYQPLKPITRDAMAAFMYRLAGSPEYSAPTKSPFVDVSTKQMFYKEMAWLAESGISTGWLEANGSRSYRALQPITRDAMAAFLFRLAELEV